MWLGEAKKYKSSYSQIIIVGTKWDWEQQREVSFEEGLKFADDFAFFEASALLNIGIDQAFESSLYELKEKYSS